MNSMSQRNIRKDLLSMRDIPYREFHAALIPTVDKNLIIGIRTPILRAYAKEINGSKDAAKFLSALPHRYYEEYNLHAFLIEQIKDYNTCIDQIDRLLPYIDNWATCDSLKPKILAKNLDKLPDQIDIWLQSEHTYARRYAIELLMNYYLDELHFKPEYMEHVAATDCSEYYIHMMVAWYFATALAKQYDTAITYIENARLDAATHNKAIQKAIESRRIPDEHKKYLRTLKRH